MNTSPSLFTQFVAVCSSDRVFSYKVNGDSDLDILTRYVWNVALCESLAPVLQGLEVALRNRLNDAIALSYANNDWLFDGGMILDEHARRRVTDAQNLLLQEGKQISSSRVVSELNLGFWTTLISARHNEGIWRRPGLLKEAFPYVPKIQRKRRVLAARFNEVRKLRNRIFHCEPIWHRELAKEHGNILESLGWLDPCLPKIYKTLDRFPEVFTHTFQVELKHSLIRACPVESKKFVLELRKATEHQN